MTRQHLLAELIAANPTLVGRYLKGFDQSNHTKQAPGLPNHVAWSLGHCALTMHRVAEKLDGRPLPDTDFIDKSQAGDARRFGAESVAFGSTPTNDPAKYPAFDRCVQIFQSACDRLIAAASHASDTQLDQKVPWGAGESALGLLVARMSFHNGMHTGQIADLRRALGMGSIFA